MSYKIGRNHERNQNRKDEPKYPTLRVIVPHSKKEKIRKPILRRRIKAIVKL